MRSLLWFGTGVGEAHHSDRFIEKIRYHKIIENEYRLGMINISLKNLELNLANLNQIPK